MLCCRFVLWARQLSLIGISAGFQTAGSEDTVLAEGGATLGVLVASLALHAHVRPYAYHLQNMLEMVLASFSIGAVALSCVFYFYHNRGGLSTSVIVAVEVCVLGMLLGPLVIIFGVWLAVGGRHPVTPKDVREPLIPPSADVRDTLPADEALARGGGEGDGGGSGGHSNRGDADGEAGGADGGDGCTTIPMPSHTLTGTTRQVQQSRPSPPTGFAPSAADVLDALSMHRFNHTPGDLEARMALQTTHRRVWAGAQLLHTFLRASAHPLGMTRADVHILELGAGAGWLGLNLAVALPLARVTLSDLPTAVGALHANVLRVGAARAGLSERVRVCALDWSAVARGHAPGAEGPWDFVIGSELTYSHAGLTALAGAMAALASPTTRVLLAHVPRRKASVDAALFDEFAAVGLALRALEWEAEAQGPASGQRVEDDGASDDEANAWVPDGGLFAEEDAALRANVPITTVYEVVRVRTVR
jgi:hypothetical protein